MKAYLITTGIIFALITLAHILRVFAEGLRLAKGIGHRTGQLTRHD